jgi:predicted anti-sigma-YlaC factor YlaD
VTRPQANRTGNQCHAVSDYQAMNCDESRNAMSARLDGEDPGQPEADLERHLAGCRSCRAFALDTGDLHRMLRVRPAEPVPDLSAAILQAAPSRLSEPEPNPMVPWLRYGLTVVGLTMLVLAIPSLVLHDSGSAIHLTRELSAWDLAFAAGLLFAAWQPVRARGLLPMAAVLAGGQLLGSLIDVGSGRAPAVSEAHHALELTGVLLLWLLCRALGHRSGRRTHHPADAPAGRAGVGLHPA